MRAFARITGSQRSPRAGARRIFAGFKVISPARPSPVRALVRVTAEASPPVRVFTRVSPDRGLRVRASTRVTAIEPSSAGFCSRSMPGAGFWSRYDTTRPMSAGFWSHFAARGPCPRATGSCRPMEALPRAWRLARCGLLLAPASSSLDTAGDWSHDAWQEGAGFHSRQVRAFVRRRLFRYRRCHLSTGAGWESAGFYSPLLLAVRAIGHASE